MDLVKNQLYHFYNQGNNRERVFYNRENQLFFLRKFKKHISPASIVIAYCLMPNHFHFLLYITENSIIEKKVGPVITNNLMNGFRLLLSSYAQAINKQEGRSGSLFRQKTKVKALDCGTENYPLICFNYIHQNPLRAGLVKRLEDWEFSSYRDYAGLRNGTISDKSLAFELLNLSEEGFQIQSQQIVGADKIENIF